MKKKTKSLAELLNESNTNTVGTIKENQGRVNLSNPGGGFMDGADFETTVGTVHVEISDTTRTGVTLDVALAPPGFKGGNYNEIVRVTISPDGTIGVVDRSKGTF